jgi:hypothetical protein
MAVQSTAPNKLATRRSIGRIPLTGKRSNKATRTKIELIRKINTIWSFSVLDGVELVILPVHRSIKKITHDTEIREREIIYRLL